jgi:hypothetical protein
VVCPLLPKRYGSHDRRGRIPNQVSIDERPAIVDARRRFGDWEGDTVIGKGHRGALVTLVERKSLYTVIRSVLHKTAEAVRHAVVDGLTPYIDWVQSKQEVNKGQTTFYLTRNRGLSPITWPRRFAHADQHDQPFVSEIVRKTTTPANR